MAGTDADDAGDAGDAGDVVHNMLPNFRENVKNVENTVFFSVFQRFWRASAWKMWKTP